MIKRHPIKNLGFFQPTFRAAQFSLATGATDQFAEHVDRKVGDCRLPLDDERRERGVAALDSQASYLTGMQNAGVPGDDAIPVGVDRFTPLIGNRRRTQNLKTGDQALGSSV
ncbi:hypothetical protein [Shinella granuli]|uniref:Uncharacterized protein n=1 Tax=Shinella granuli TaxID=323621 RepID=A0A4R2C4R6_SHIGR|nr:hypothetical protein [Shinella granuli]TCN35408.1 hypothetical protein EV665_12818 [Shinella granuli]